FAIFGTLGSKTCSRNLFAQILQTSAEGETTVVSLCFIYRTKINHQSFNFNFINKQNLGQNPLAVWNEY
ncbi:hypothetical protein BpHYR1_023352, partial [Brachionus plicatilis]